MIRPAIAPTRVFNPISRGLFTAARNSVNQVQQSTQKISRGLNKDQKFAMNYVEFFGSKKTTKVLRKNLKSITKSLKTTFDIAKNLKSEVGKMAKGGGLLKGLAGTIGAGLFGGLFGKLTLGVLAGIAVGGIGFLLYKNAGTFFRFLNDKVAQLTPIIEGIIIKYFAKIASPPGQDELMDLSSENVIDNIDKIRSEQPDITSDEAITLAVNREIEQLEKLIKESRERRKELRKKPIQNFSAVMDEDRKVEALKATIGFLRTGQKFTGPFSFISSRIFDGTVPKNYDKLTSSERETTVKNIVNQSSNINQLEFETLRLSGMPQGDVRTRFFEDVLNFINAKKENKLDKFQVLPDEFDNFGEIRKGNKEEFKSRFGGILKKSSSNNQGTNVIVNGQDQSSMRTDNGDGKVSSTKADGGALDIAFLSPQNFDSSQEKTASCVAYGCYMDA